MGRKNIGSVISHVGLFVIVFGIYTISCRGTKADVPDTVGTRTTGDIAMTDLTRQELVRRAGPLGFPILTALQKPETEVERIPTSFFSDGGIYRVSTRPPDRPRVFVLGVWGKDGIKVLNNDPKAFFDLAANCGLRLTAGRDYVAYVTTFLDATRDFLGGVQVLNSIEESWWLPKPTPEESRQREEVIAKYAKVVESPKLSGDSGSTVVVYCIRDRALIRMNAKVESSGHIQIGEDVLVAEMPTVLLR